MKLILLILALSIPAQAALTINVVPSSAPNGFNSPSWSGYLSNATYAIENSLTSVGSVKNPTSYQSLAKVMPGQFTVSNFTSWRGKANPIEMLANEHGNRLHFGVHVVGDGTQQFTLHDLSVSIASNDAANGLGDSFSFASENFTSARKGINWGADRVKGTSDDIVYSSGAGTPLLDEFVYVGLGTAFDASFEDGATNQEKLDSVADYVAVSGLTTITGTWNVGTDSQAFALPVMGSSRAVPEPAIGLLAIALLLRRRLS